MNYHFMPGLESVSKLENINLEDNVSQKELQDLQDFEGVLKTLDFEQQDVQDSLNKANPQIEKVLAQLDKASIEGLSDEDQQALVRVKDVFAALLQDKTYHPEAPEEDLANNGVSNNESANNIETGNDVIDSRTDEVSEVIESAEQKMALRLMENPTSKDAMHDVFHVNEGAFKEFLNLADKDPAKAEVALKAYYKAMNGDIGKVDHVERGYNKEGKLGLLAIPHDGPGREGVNYESGTFGMPPDDQAPDWVKEKNQNGSSSNNLKKLKNDLESGRIRFGSGLKGMMEKLNYLGGLIASSLDEFGLFDLPDWIKDKAEKFKQEMEKQKIDPGNRDKYTVAASEEGMKEYFMKKYKTPEEKNSVLNDDDGDLTGLRSEYLSYAKGREIGSSDDDVKMYEGLASHFKFEDVDDLFMKTTKKERVSFFQQYEQHLQKQEQDAEKELATNGGSPEGGADVNGETFSMQDGMTQMLPLLQLEGMTGQVTLSTSPIHGKYLEVNGMPIALDQDGQGIYSHTDSAGITSLFRVVFNKETNGLVVHPRQVLEPLNGPLAQQDDLTVRSHLMTFLGAEKFKPGKVTLSEEERTNYKDIMLNIQKDLVTPQVAGTLATMKEKYANPDNQLSPLIIKINNLKAAGNAAEAGVYETLQSEITSYLNPAPVPVSGEVTSEQTPTGTESVPATSETVAKSNEETGKQTSSNATATTTATTGQKPPADNTTGNAAIVTQ